MKKINFFGVVALVFLIAQAMSAQEIIKGGAFAQTDRASWTIGVGTDGNVGQVAFGSTLIPAGSVSTTAARFTYVAGTSEIQMYQRVKLVGGKLYKVSARLRVQAPAANRAVQVYVMKDLLPDNGTKFSDAIINIGIRSKANALFLEGWPFSPTAPLANISGPFPLSLDGPGTDLIAPDTSGDYLVLIKMGQWGPTTGYSLSISDLSIKPADVTSIPVVSVSVPRAVNLIAIGETFPLVTTFNPTNATNKAVTWTSSNPAVATVSATGVVTAVGNGNATVTITTADGQKTASSAVNVTTFKFQEVWRDDFNGTGAPDPTKWGYELGKIRNNEEQYYTNRPENVVQKDGNLEITVIKEPFEGSQYTSASVTTEGRAAWTYGRIRGRFKIPTGQGYHACFWTLGNNYRQVWWPTCGELDIFERINLEKFVHSSAHWANLDGSRIARGNTSPELDFNQWHVYTMEWTPISVKYFVDDNPIPHQVLDIKDAINNTRAFHLPHYILINQVMGGEWPGAPNAETVFPGKMLVDWVEVSAYVPDVPAAASAILVSPSSMNVPISKTLQLTADFIPFITVDKTMNWSSSNPAIATVSNTGLVTGVALGVATITGTSVSGNRTATSQVTVVDPATLNFVLNPSFEIDNTPIQRAANWPEWGPPGAATPDQAQIVGTNPRTGRFNAEMRGPCNVLNFQDIRNLPNGAYTLKGWFRSSGGQSYTVMSIKDHGGAEITRSLGAPMSAWTEVSIPVTITSGLCQIGIYSANATLGQWIEFDDISLTLNPDLSSSSFSFDTISVYPNPVSNNLLNISNPNSDNYEVRIFNLLGQNLFVEKSISGDKTINTSFLTKGIYVLVISNGTNNLVKKIVIP